MLISKPQLFPKKIFWEWKELWDHICDEVHPQNVEWRIYTSVTNVKSHVTDVRGRNSTEDVVPGCAWCMLGISKLSPTRRAGFFWVSECHLGPHLWCLNWAIQKRITAFCSLATSASCFQLIYSFFFFYIADRNFFPPCHTKYSIQARLMKSCSVCVIISLELLPWLPRTSSALATVLASLPSVIFSLSSKSSVIFLSVL